MKPICSFCGKEMKQVGGLAFSPPADVDRNHSVTKLHICRRCWDQKIRPIAGEAPEEDDRTLSDEKSSENKVDELVRKISDIAMYQHYREFERRVEVEQETAGLLKEILKETEEG